MENHKLVLPEHLNHYGYLFGGHLLNWVDEFAWIAVSLDYPDCNFVTIGMDKIEFKRSVKEGTILKFLIRKSKMGKTSVQYEVTIFSRKGEVDKRVKIFSTHVTFVHIGKDGKKKLLPK